MSNISKFSSYIDFSLSHADTSFITYEGVRLYYPKFKGVRFQQIMDQYKNIKKNNLILNINGLVVQPSAKIEDIITTPQEEQLFQIILNWKEDVLLIQKKYQQEFNNLIYRIMTINEGKKQVLQQQKNQEKQNFSKLLNNVEKIQKSPFLDMWEYLHNCKSEKMIFWIDDEPHNNSQIIHKYFTYKNIGVVQIPNTEDTIKTIQAKFGQLIKQGKRIIFISDMTRKQGLFWNNEAGMDLYEHIYYKKNLQIRGILFVQNEKAAHEKIKARNLMGKNIVVVREVADLVNEVYKNFGISPLDLKQ